MKLQATVELILMNQARSTYIWCTERQQTTECVTVTAHSSSSSSSDARNVSVKRIPIAYSSELILHAALLY